MTDFVAISDPVLAYWSLANNHRLPDNARIFLAGCLLQLTGNPVSHPACADLIELARKEVGGVSLEVARHMATRPSP